MIKRLAAILAGVTLLAACEQGTDDAAWCESMKNTPQESWSAADAQRYAEECGAAPAATEQGGDATTSPTEEATPPTEEATPPTEEATPPADEAAEKPKEESAPPPDGD